MREEAKGVLKSLPAPPRPLCYSVQLSKFPGEEGDDFIGLTIVEGANHNGIGREKRHKRTKLNPNIGRNVTTVPIRNRLPKTRKVQMSKSLPTGRQANAKMIQCQNFFFFAKFCHLSFGFYLNL